MKTKAPQFDLPIAGDVFNLALETAVDGERLRRELDAAATETFLAQQLQSKQQLELCKTDMTRSNPQPQP